MPSVLHVTESTSGGVAAVVRDLAADQVGRGWRVVVASPARDGIARDVVATGAAHEVWPAVRAPGPGTPREVARLRTIVRRAAPDVVHLHSSKAGLAGRLVIRGRIPTLFQPHAWSFFALDGRIAGLARAWERAGARWTDLLVCCSADELDAGRQLGIRAEALVVANAVDTERFHPVDDATRAEWRRELLGPTDADGPVVVCPGRFCHQKGQDVLLAGWPAVRAAVPDARLVLVGGGPDEARLRAVAPADVRFVGWQPGMLRWLAVADVVVQPSRYEGMSMATLEAMALARPIVATTATGMREALGAQSEALVPVEDPGGLATALVRRLVDPSLAAREAAAARARAEQRFSLPRWRETMAEATTRVAARDGAATRPLGSR